MSVRKMIVSDLSGVEIDEKQAKTLTVTRQQTRRSSYGGTYRNTVSKKLHLTEDEAASFFTKEVRQWLGWEKKPKAESKKKTAAKP